MVWVEFVSLSIGPHQRKLGIEGMGTSVPKGPENLHPIFVIYISSIVGVCNDVYRD